MNDLNETRLGGALATFGIILVASVSAWMNWHFWEARGDPAAAWLTVGAELIAVGGFVMVLHHWRDRRWTALGGLTVTLLSAGWGGLTMFERLNAEAHDRATEAAAAAPGYRQAAQELETASQLYIGALAAEVPQGLGPLTTDAVSRANEARAQRLKGERDRAQARLASLTPAGGIDLLALIRGFGIQIATLLGLAVYGAGARFREVKAETPHTEEAVAPRPLTASELGKLGAAAKAARRREEQERRERAAAYMRDYRARKAGKWSVDLFGPPASAALH